MTVISTNMRKLLAVIIMIAVAGLVVASFSPILTHQALAGGGHCGGCATLFAPGTEAGTGGTIGGGHEPAKAFAPGQISTGSASDVAPGHLKP